MGSTEDHPQQAQPQNASKKKDTTMCQQQDCTEVRLAEDDPMFGNPEHIKSLDISPIRHNKDGSYSFTINGSTYWTSRDGDGLFCSTYTETKGENGAIWMHGDHNKQLLGFAQFNLAGLSPTTRRRRVIVSFVKDNPCYQRWLSHEGERHSQANAMTFYRYYLDPKNLA